MSLCMCHTLILERVFGNIPLYITLTIQDPFYLSQIRHMMHIPLLCYVPFKRTGILLPVMSVAQPQIYHTD